MMKSTDTTPRADQPRCHRYPLGIALKSACEAGDRNRFDDSPAASLGNRSSRCHVEQRRYKQIDNKQDSRYAYQVDESALPCERRQLHISHEMQPRRLALSPRRSSPVRRPPLLRCAPVLLDHVDDVGDDEGQHNR